MWSEEKLAQNERCKLREGREKREGEKTRGMKRRSRKEAEGTGRENG